MRAEGKARNDIESRQKLYKSGRRGFTQNGHTTREELAPIQGVEAEVIQQQVSLYREEDSRPYKERRDRIYSKMVHRRGEGSRHDVSVRALHDGLSIGGKIANRTYALYVVYYFPICA